jgi:anti-anti-sigma regulatory factor
MNIVFSQEQGRVPVTVLRPQDRINLGNAGHLEQAGREAFARGARNLLIDLSEVPSLTSAGLSALRTLYQLLADQAPPVSEEITPTHVSSRARSRHLKLLNPTPEVRRVLNIAGFDAFIDIHDDLQTAVQSF